MKVKYPKILATLLFLLIVVSCNEDDILKENSQQQALPEELLTPEHAHISARIKKIACGAIKEVKLLAGQHTEAGSVLAYNDETNLYIEYVTTGGWMLAATHLYVGKKENIPGTKSGNPKVGHFPYQHTHGAGTTNFVYTIPLSELEACFVVAAHAEVQRIDNKGKVEQEETAWAEGIRMVQKGNWAMYFETCKQVCIIEYPTKNSVATVAFEDLYPGRGDADYNDLVVDMNIKEHYLGDRINKIEMVFRAKARGAGYDHSFLIRLPIEGTASVEISRYASQAEADADNPYESESMQNVGGQDLKIAAFKSTKAILPASAPEPYSFSANTAPGGAFVTSHVAKVTVLLNEDAEILLPAPYDPIMFVKNTNKEVHVLEITDKEDADGDGAKDYWEDIYGIHPFGILIPTDWAWPLEKVEILKVYPDFKYIKDGNDFRPENADWYDNRNEPSSPDEKLYFKTEYFK